MVRKMAYVGISYVLGLFFASFFSVKINLVFILTSIILLVGYYICYKKRKRQIIVSAIVFIIAILSNITYTKICYEKILKYENESVTVCGEAFYIKNLANDKSLVYIDGIIDNKTKAKISAFIDSSNIDYNDTIMLECKLSTPENTIAFGSNDYLKAKNIFLQSSDITAMQVIKDNSFSIRNTAEKYRNYVISRIRTILPKEEGAVLCSMVCGDKSALDDNTLDTLYECGIGHIMAVSGVHVMIISALLLLIIRKLRLNKYIQFFVAEGAAIFFCVFTGLRPSTIRATIMFSILMIGIISKHRADALNSLGIAGILLTAFNPFVVRDPSFLLSFIGTFAITSFAPMTIEFINAKGKYKKIINYAITMICISVCIFPISALYFDEFSLLAPISNMFLAPLCVIAIVCGVVVVFTGCLGALAYPFLIVAGVLLKVVLLLAKLLASLPFSTYPTGYMYVPLAIFLCIIGIIIITYLFMTKKAMLMSIMSSILIISITTCIINFSQRDIYKITILTKKSSTAIVVTHENNTCVIDLEGKGEISDVVSHYLYSKGVKDIDVLILNQNEQKSISSYKANSKGEINNVIVTKDDRFYLPKTNLIKLSSGENVSLEKINLNVLDESNYSIDIGDFCLICYGNNDMINKGFDTCNLVLNCNDEMSLISGKQTFYFDKDNSKGQAYVIEAKTSGNFKVRRIDYALRE